MTDMIGDYIREERAQDAALQRLVRALGANYAAILAEETTNLGYTSGGAPYDYNPEPEAWVVTNQHLLEELPRNHYTFGVIYPVGPHVYGKERSGGAGYNGAETTFDVVVLVVSSFAPAPADLLDKHGNDASEEAWMIARARAQKAAIMRSLRYYARDTGNDVEKVIYDIKLRENHAFPRFSKDRMRLSVGYTNWRIYQHVAIPERRAMP